MEVMMRVCMILVGLLSLMSIEAYEVGLTFLDSAVAQGAVCLDGSAPAYHMDKGFGAGIDNWLVFFEKTNLYFRGARIFRAVIEDLLAKGMKNAKNAMLAGCSAGGLTSILQCDNFRSLLPSTTKVKCLSDAGFFINAKTIIGTSHIEGFYADVVKTHDSAKVLSPACTSKMSPGLCFFPQNMVQYIETPIFLINAAYDSWQVKNILAPGVADQKGTWRECKLDITKCSSAQLNILQGYRQEFLKALTGFDNSSSRGMFINSCYSHCQTGIQETWLRNDSPLLSNTTIAKAVGDWYYERGTFQKIDCPYPCDKTCHNRVFE